MRISRRHNGYRVALALAALLSVAADARAGTDWFPPEFEAGATRQLSDRLLEVGVAEGKTEQERAEYSRRFVAHVVARLDAWGLEKVLEYVPDLSEVDFPPTDQPIVAAIAVCGACALPLHPELVETREEKLFIALGEVSVTIVSAFLRHHALAAGVSDREMVDYLASAAMNQLSYDVQVEAEARNYVAAQCGPMFEAILE